MRIGEFSKKNNISIETVRHYIDLELIMPHKKGGQYDFDENSQRTLNKVLELKSYGFTLNEVKSIIVYELLGKFTLEDSNLFKKFFELKEKEINKKIKELSIMEEKLKYKIKEITTQEEKKGINIGIDINTLEYFSCISCGGDLYLEEGNIKNNKIIDGKLKCKCGRDYNIECGILIVENNNRSNENSYENIIEDYLKDTDFDYISNIRKGLDWGYNNLEKVDLNNKVLLEIGSGLGFTLRNLYNILDNTTYIAIDNDINKHIYLKSLLENSNLNNNIILICTDFKKIPIKEDIIDIFLDCSGSSNYWFENNDFSISDILKYLKKDAYVILSYIIFKKIRLNNSIKIENRKNFNIKYVKEEIKKYNFNIIDEISTGYLSKPSAYENYFNEGEEVYTYMYYGKR